MKSFLEVISKDATFAYCEIEMIRTDVSMKKDLVTGNVLKVYVPLSKFNMVSGSVNAGDVFVVLHNAGRVIKVCERDMEARAKRKALKRRVAIATA